MRSLDGRLIADLNDRLPANVTGSVFIYNNSDIDENLTTYQLLPERINYPPYVSRSIAELSTPQIKPIQFNDPDKVYLYTGEDGTVKVSEGSSFVLRFRGVQPPIENIQNGIPTMINDQTQLLYEWQKDGTSFDSLADLSRLGSTVIVSGSPYGTECIFTNASIKQSGIYTCTVTNDIGTTTSEAIVIDVVQPDANPMFYKNLVENSSGENGVDLWQGDQELVVSTLNANLTFENLSRPWRVDLFGYTKDMFYPRPYQLNTYFISNSNLEHNFQREGYYYTRDKFKYTVDDGKADVVSILEVDLQDLREYIQGSIYGVDGVRAVFGCYIGNAVSAFTVSALNAIISKRSHKYTLLPNLTRISLLNTLLAGVPQFYEKVTVNIQEYSNETPLMSDNNIPGYTLNDPWSEIINTWYGDKDISQGYTTDITTIPTSDSAGETSRAIYAIQNNLLYPTQLFVPTYGQYAKFNRLVINKLNHLTDKIRIQITFGMRRDILEQGKRDGIDDVFELYDWQPVQKPLHWPQDWKRDNMSDEYGNIINVSTYIAKQLGILGKNHSVYDVLTVLGAPRGLVNSLNLVLYPLDANYPQKTDYFTKTILTPIDNPDATIKDLTYPDLINGTEPSSDLGIYMASLSANGYKSEIVGVNIQHALNLPNGGARDEWRAGDGHTPTSLTSVKTYMFQSQSYNSNNNIYDFNNTSSWKETKLDDIMDLSRRGELDTKYIILYDKEPGKDIRDITLEQVIGNLSAETAKYTNNMISVIPLTFTTASTGKFYLGSLGFDLEVEGQKYGVPTTDYIATETQYVNDWQQYVGSVGKATIEYKLLQDIKNPTTNINYPAAKAPTQIIVYSTEFGRHLGRSYDYYSLGDSLSFDVDRTVNNDGSKQYYAYRDRVMISRWDNTVNRASGTQQSAQVTVMELFNFPETSVYEYGNSTPGSYGYYARSTRYAPQTWAQWEIDNASIPSSWDDFWSPYEYIYNLTVGVFNSDAKGQANLTSNPRKIPFVVTAADGKQVDVRTPITSYARGWGSTGYAQDEKAYPVVFTVGVDQSTSELLPQTAMITHGGTYSRVELNKVVSKGVTTPSAIIVPEKKKIYYFVYNYTQDMFNEK